MNTKKDDITKCKFRFNEWLGETTIRLIAFISLAAIWLILLFVFREATPLFSSSETPLSDTVDYSVSETYGEVIEDSAEIVQNTYLTEQGISSFDGEVTGSLFRNLLGKEWQPISENPKYGLIPIILGTFKVTLIALLIAGPIGILSALYVSAFAPKRLKGWLKPAVELLAGFPSVVIGFFALTVIASTLQVMFNLQFRLNALTGGVALSLAVIPIIFTVTEDALNAVPKSLKEASLALGASNWQTALFAILPAATPGVLAALLLGFGRSFGETMIVLMATGNAALLSLNPFEPIRTMSATIGAEMAEVVFGDTHYSVLFLIGVILFIVTFIINAIAEFYVRQKLRRRFGG